MSNIRVTYGEIEQVAGQLAQGRDEIISRLRLLESQITQLVSTGFVTDQASVRFHSMYSEYTAGASIVAEKLSEIQAFLTQAAGAIREMDAQLAARIS
ncbi:WXG100 family type VII secretion target [Leucobacter sp. W1153]|uniref:WXG100 family type VII secretion target n=1 Tax=unclassified Leucobacter TaxID=2621730 RepID=UPI003F3A995D